MNCALNIVIIGSGLGGLTCGVVLAKNGYNVTVLEQQAQVGGCLQCFERRGARFETGMHFIGSAAEGQTLNGLLRYLEVLPDIALSRLDPLCYEVVALGGDRFAFASGRSGFIDGMGRYFPRQRDALVRYYDLVRAVCCASPLRFANGAQRDGAANSVYMLRSVNEVIDEVIADPLLARVLAGNLPLYAGVRDRTPFATHAFIRDFYNQSAFRIVGGSDGVAKSLVKTVCRYGGRVLTRQRVTRIVCDDSRAIGVETEGGFMPADIVISDAHPMRTLEMLDSRLIRPAFRARICAMPQTVGAFALYLHFREDCVPYMNHNFYGYRYGTPWDCEQYDEETWPKGYLYMHLCHEATPRYAKSGVILTYMQMDDVRRWMGTQVGHRGEDYEVFKRRKAERLLDAVERDFPRLRDHIAHYYTSTPLTYLDYTGTEGGSMYGVARDVTMGAACRVPHRTKVPNVLLTGQNINSHGILGVIVGALVTCSELLTAKTIYEQIVNSD